MHNDNNVQDDNRTQESYLNPRIDINRESMIAVE